MVEVAVIQTHKGRRDFIFPPVPKKLSLDQQKAICTLFAKKEFVSRGMVCECTFYETGEIMFSCTTRKLERDDFGDVVEEWGTTEFFVLIKKSFAKAVNDELQRMGLPRTYEII